ncbi:tRNA pseudouridine(55) synthase TruB [Fulvivirgaceae bacterium BMA10]|uniref:tRNA pseudouridine synthase B n=1 Tax=Splendidivirga corallicola TaxID=3051826 RepID=A0ABT8KIA7_9BACT|nr:tRNA pseudouridine(55) synthase TruB [Fulvivirgaceae bacterium BMA10]
MLRAYSNFNEGETILIDKPYQWTSFDVVKKLRYALKIKKIGHAGTLDPLATGLLIICTGKMTKQIEKYQAQEKEYEGKLILGQITPSIDLETEIIETKDISHIEPEDILNCSKQFVGEIEQIPPAFSAIKLDGQRAYKKARKGIELALKPRTVFIKEFTITNIKLPEISFRVVCSKGTYIRSLVRDFGNSLQVGAYMSELTRTRIGEYKLSSAYTLEEFIEQYKVLK